MNLDPDRVWPALAAVPGAALYGLYSFAVLVRSGQPVTARALINVALNVLCAALAGMIMAFMIAKAIAGLIPWAAVRDPFLIGFVFGALGWELLPLAFKAARGRAERELGKLDGSNPQ